MLQQAEIQAPRGHYSQYSPPSYRQNGLCDNCQMPGHVWTACEYELHPLLVRKLEARERYYTSMRSQQYYPQSQYNHQQNTNQQRAQPAVHNFNVHTNNIQEA